MRWCVVPSFGVALVACAWIAGCTSSAAGDVALLALSGAAAPAMGRGGAASRQAAEVPPAAEADAPPEGGWTFLEAGRTFERLIADQRWPVFSASYRFQSGGTFLDQYEHLSVGDTFALARGPVTIAGREFELELGGQAGIFSVFDPGLIQNLIIVDYQAGAYASIRRGPASGMLRFWHLSGHIGDEFLLEEHYGVDDRTPYKFDAIGLLGSYDLPHGWRVYGGPNLLFGVNPGDFGKLLLQAGLEWRAEQRLWRVARPVAAADVQMVEGLGYNPDLSLRAGLSFDRGRSGPAIQILAEFYSGRDPNGELFVDRVTFAGIGLFFHF